MDGEERTVHVLLVHLVPSVPQSVFSAISIDMVRNEFSKIFIS